ncbi:cytochrome c oxidase accessory protein CcoG [Acanthopleuribacter pedis]|uniref:Cytochrome c oxidase accessory protein CcoG n=1 Tax=Acanthopleuribacter pedis TaxID=442870 RepID=A0A8J7QG12_9BACT|nr:cytochrome c oxidase accessory protein CcoG [Acanthopleuribacter pedis]MBO1317903.1 cytochrome c oxidase accessory protein CcoG [Acanthopleuribacter pedis]
MNGQIPTREKMTTIGDGGKRFWLYPAKFTGEWLNRRRVMAVVLILFFFILPWIDINGSQAVLLDIADRKFAFFGLVLWPQDFSILWFFAAGTAILVLFLTAQWGRLWCGWACPQTVFLEHVFRRIEIWIEGDARQRRKLDQAPISVSKFSKKALKYVIFIAISSHFANTVLCYFVGTDQVLHMTFQDPRENWGWFTFMAFFNFMFFVDFAWFREQFCLIACPYGRFQSVLLDSDSMIVGYDYNRGEPRGKLRKNQERTEGDCIDCNRCVAVCPTGIDIRQGLQMECINCTACMDACDEIMFKVNKPPKLIRYTAIADLEGRVRRFMRPRVIVYLVLVLALYGAGTYLMLFNRGLKFQIVRPPGQSFTLSEADAVVSNHFEVKATNRSEAIWTVTTEVPAGFEVVTPRNPWEIPAEETATLPIFVRKQKTLFNTSGKERAVVTFRDERTGAVLYQTEVTLMGPAQ